MLRSYSSELNFLQLCNTCRSSKLRKQSYYGHDSVGTLPKKVHNNADNKLKIYSACNLYHLVPKEVSGCKWVCSCSQFFAALRIH